MKPDKFKLFPFLLVSLLFLMWGIANNMNDTLLAAFKRIMSMSDLQTSLVQFAFYGAYFCFALPAAIFINRYGYKAGILTGLSLYALGTLLFRPAGDASSYPFFLFAIYVMASGCSVLETTANPYILAMGPKETATRRLNIAQTFNPVGAIIGILLSRHLILSQLHEADAAERAGMDESSLHQIMQGELSAVSGTYLVIGAILVVLLLVILFAKMPKPDVSQSEGEDSSSSLKSSFRALKRNKRYCSGVVAQFFYVGVQTCMWSFTIRMVMAETGVRESDASLVFLWSILAFTGCRMLFTWLMKWIKPSLLLTIAACGGLAGVIGVMTLSGTAVSAAIVFVSGCMSLMFPTIYALSLEDVGPRDAKLASSGLIMAILGGALITPCQAMLSDKAGITVSFMIPLFCFVVVTIYSITQLKQRKVS